MSNESEEPSLVEECSSLMLDFVPVIGSGKSVVELISGKDVITGQEINRWLAAGGIILGLIPFGKVLTKGAKAANMVKTAGTKLAYGVPGAETLIKKIEKIGPKGAKEIEQSFVLQEIKAVVRPDELKTTFGAHSNPLNLKSDIKLVQQSPARLLHSGVLAVKKHWISGGTKDLFEQLSHAERKKFQSELKEPSDVFAYLHEILTDRNTIKIRLPKGNQIGYANNKKKVLLIHNSGGGGNFSYEPSPIKALKKLHDDQVVRFAAKSTEDALYHAEKHAVEALQDGVAKEYRHSTKYWSRYINFKGNRVYQNNSVTDDGLKFIDPLRLSKEGETSLQLMRKGRAPIGPDNMPIDIHHTIQMQKHPLAEVSHTFHKKYSKILHINQPAKNFPSGIDRGTFDAWKKKYWMNRAKDFK